MSNRRSRAALEALWLHLEEFIKAKEVEDLPHWNLLKAGLRLVDVEISGNNRCTYYVLCKYMYIYIYLCRLFNVWNVDGANYRCIERLM